jgi:hypothetical protein
MPKVRMIAPHIRRRTVTGWPAKVYSYCRRFTERLAAILQVRWLADKPAVINGVRLQRRLLAAPI